MEVITGCLVQILPSDAKKIRPNRLEIVDVTNCFEKDK